MDVKRFTKNDSGFICENCSLKVEPLGYTSRNHCPFCLCSKHIDNNPGDRECGCAGLMIPIIVEPDSKKGYIITHKCKKCGALKRNKYQADDNNELLIKLTNPYH